MVDADIISHDDLKSYVKFHWSKVVSQIPDKTPRLNLWLTEESINKIRDNKQLIKTEYVALLVERFWLQFIQTRLLELTRAKTAEFVKNTSCDLLRILTNQKIIASS